MALSASGNRGRYGVEQKTESSSSQAKPTRAEIKEAYAEHRTATITPSQAKNLLDRVEAISSGRLTTSRSSSRSSSNSSSRRHRSHKSTPQAKPTRAEIPEARPSNSDTREEARARQEAEQKTQVTQKPTEAEINKEFRSLLAQGKSPEEVSRIISQKYGAQVTVKEAKVAVNKPAKSQAKPEISSTIDQKDIEKARQTLKQYEKKVSSYKKEFGKFQSEIERYKQEGKLIEQNGELVWVGSQQEYQALQSKYEKLRQKYEGLREEREKAIEAAEVLNTANKVFETAEKKAGELSVYGWRAVSPYSPEIYQEKKMFMGFNLAKDILRVAEAEKRLSQELYTYAVGRGIAEKGEEIAKQVPLLGEFLVKPAAETFGGWVIAAGTPVEAAVKGIELTETEKKILGAGASIGYYGAYSGLAIPGMTEGGAAAVGRIARAVPEPVKITMAKAGQKVTQAASKPVKALTEMRPTKVTSVIEYATGEKAIGKGIRLSELIDKEGIGISGTGSRRAMLVRMKAVSEGDLTPNMEVITGVGKQGGKVKAGVRVETGKGKGAVVFTIGEEEISAIRFDKPVRSMQEIVEFRSRIGKKATAYAEMRSGESTVKVRTGKKTGTLRSKVIKESEEGRSGEAGRGDIVSDIDRISEDIMKQADEAGKEVERAAIGFEERPQPRAKAEPKTSKSGRGETVLRERGETEFQYVKADIDEMVRQMTSPKIKVSAGMLKTMAGAALVQAPKQREKPVILPVSAPKSIEDIENIMREFVFAPPKPAVDNIVDQIVKGGQIEDIFQDTAPREIQRGKVRVSTPVIGGQIPAVDIPPIERFDVYDINYPELPPFEPIVPPPPVGSIPLGFYPVQEGGGRRAKRGTKINPVIEDPLSFVLGGFWPRGGSRGKKKKKA